MLLVKIADKEFEYLDAVETEEYYNGASRRTLTFNCAANAIGLDELNALLIEDNLTTITLHNAEDDITNFHEGYVLKLSVGLQNYLVNAETLDAPAVYEDRIVFKLGKRTYIEEQLHRLGVS